MEIFLWSWWNFISYLLKGDYIPMTVLVGLFRCMSVDITTVHALTYSEVILRAYYV